MLVLADDSLVRPVKPYGWPAGKVTHQPKFLNAILTIRPIHRYEAGRFSSAR